MLTAFALWAVFRIVRKIGQPVAQAEVSDSVHVIMGDTHFMGR